MRPFYKTMRSFHKGLCQLLKVMCSNPINARPLTFSSSAAWIFTNYEKKNSTSSFYPQVNLFFLLNIMRVLITKLKVTHQAESSLYMKAVRATLILVPLLGIQFVLLPYKPAGRVLSEIYDYVMNILMHYQVSVN